MPVPPGVVFPCPIAKQIEPNIEAQPVGRDGKSSTVGVRTSISASWRTKCLMWTAAPSSRRARYAELQLPVSAACPNARSALQNQAALWACVLWRRQARAPVIVSATWTAILFWLSACAGPHFVVNAKLPVQIQPTFQEPRLPAFIFLSGGTVGSVGTDPGLSSSGAKGDGSAVAGLVGADAGSAALDLVNSQSWRAQARPSRPLLDVNASALAATGMVESQCQNVAVTTGASDAAGAFQMISPTYTADINGAMAEDPFAAHSRWDPRRVQTFAAAERLDRICA